MGKPVIRVSVSKICKWLYPYRTEPDKERLKAGLEAEEIAAEKIDHDEYQKRLECDIGYREFDVHLVGVPDFIKYENGRVIIYEKKNYYLGKHAFERTRLQLSLYALLYSEVYSVDYEDIICVIVREDDTTCRIKKKKLEELYKIIYQYAYARYLMDNLQEK